MSKGYIQSAEKIRDRLLVGEWELSRKPVAMRRCGGDRGPLGFGGAGQEHGWKGAQQAGRGAT